MNYNKKIIVVNGGDFMKVRVIENYVDKNTKWFMEKGMTAEYEPERAEELIKGGYVESAEKKPAKGKKTAKKGE